MSIHEGNLGPRMWHWLMLAKSEKIGVLVLKLKSGLELGLLPLLCVGWKVYIHQCYSSCSAALLSCRQSSQWDEHSMCFAQCALYV